MTSRDAILGRITDRAEKTLPPPWPKPTIDGDLVTRFTAELEALGAEVVPIGRLAEIGDSSVFVDDDVPPELVAGLQITDRVWDADVGITMADYGIADTGSFVLTAGPGRHRLASLAPPHHIAVLARTKILDTSEAALAALATRTAVFVTGPSRTADIEGVIVRGIHGPRRLWVVLTV